MKFYRIVDSYFEDGAAYLATLREAKASAREAAQVCGYPVKVDRVECETTKVGIVALANGRGWCISSEAVFTAKPRGKVKDEL